MKYSGTIKRIGARQDVSEKFSKREFVVTDPQEQYPQIIQFEVQNNMCDIMDAFVVGSMVDIEFTLRGREWTDPKGKVCVFNTLVAWKVTNKVI